MNLEVIIVSEVSQTEKDRYYMVLLIRNLKYDTNEVIRETERDSQTQRIDLRLPKRGVWLDWELGLSRRKLLYREMVNNKGLLYSSGNHIQCPVKNYVKEYEIGCVCTHIHTHTQLSHFAI